MKFQELYNLYKWKPIHNCPGRFLLGRSSLDLFKNEYNNLNNIKEYRVPKAKDIVLVVELEDGGLISFQHEDGFIVHTLNTVEGLSRKLRQLEILK